ncbi:MAG TPA: AAA family ATPase [Terriglobales bacterium]|jgi:predicted ATP-dependent endonuclease of OLD family|nr:AAA family ATPase [Terriglobales bacterium]
MKLKSVHVREYKSILDSTKFETGDVTCLVGKNESGKTAVLEALSHLNPVIEAKAKFDTVIAADVA